MKYLAIVILLIAILNAHAGEYSFIIKSNKAVPQMDYQLELILDPQIKNNKMILDCQSFVNGLHLLEYSENKWSDQWFFMLSGNDCEDAAMFSINSKAENKPYCLSLNFEKYNLDLSYDLNLCR